MPMVASSRMKALAAANGSSPSAQSTIERLREPTAASASGRSSVGTTSVGSRSGDRTSTVSRSVIAVGW